LTHSPPSKRLRRAGAWRSTDLMLRMVLVRLWLLAIELWLYYTNWD
jgi:hypothetical protein